MCVILYEKINGMNIIAKNRDRAYKPYIDIIHEIVNGIEIIYIHDRTNLWIEGMNEYGVGIINSTLSIHDGKITTKKRCCDSWLFSESEIFSKPYCFYIRNIFTF